MIPSPHSHKHLIDSVSVSKLNNALNIITPARTIIPELVALGNGKRVPATCVCIQSCGWQVQGAFSPESSS